MYSCRCNPLLCDSGSRILGTAVRCSTILYILQFYRLADIEERVDKPILSAERGAPDGQPCVRRQADLAVYGHASFDSCRATAGPKKVSRSPGFRLRAAEDVSVHKIFDLHEV